MSSRGKKFLYWSIGIVAAIFILLAFIPAILSTGPGSQFLLNRVSRNVPGKLTAENISLRWFGSQEIDGLTLSTPGGQKVASVDEITVERALLPLIWGSTDFGHVTVKGTRLDLIIDADGSSNLQRALARFRIPLQPQLAAVTPQLSFSANLPQGTLVLEDVQVTVNGATQAELSVPKLVAARPLQGGPLTVRGAGTVQHAASKGNFDVDLEVERFRNEHILDALKSAHGSLRANQFPVIIADELLVQKGQLVQLIGETANVDLQMEPSRAVGKLTAPLLNADLNITPTEATVQATGQNLQIKPTRFSLGERIVLDQPTQIVALWQGSPLTIDVQKFELPVGDWRKGHAFFTVSGDNLQLQVDAKQLDRGAVDGKIQVRQFPSDFEGEFFVTEEGHLTLPRFRFELEGRNLEVDFVGRYTAAEQVEFLSPVHVRYYVIPELLSRPEVLTKPFEVETYVEVNTLSLENMQASGKITSSDILLSDGSITDIQGSFSFDVPRNSAKVTLRAKSDAQGDKGQVRLDATLSNFFQKGALDWQGMDANIDANFKPLPAAVLMLAAGTKHRADQIEALLGRRADLVASAKLKKMSGPVTAELDSQNTRGELRGVLTNGTLTLAAPLKASMTITPAIGARFLADFNPLLVSAVRGEQPVTLVVDPQGFSTTHRIADLQIGKATLDLGKLWVRNSGTIRDLLQLFKRSQLNEQNEVLVWTTPIYISAENGVLTYHRADMVIGTSIQVAFWGTADLANNALRMTLAIPGYSLRKVLGLDDIPDTRYLIIPVRGNVDDAKIDYATAVPRIAALLARKEGTTGRVVGALVETAVGTLAGQDKVPPPSTQPFPWANDPNYRFPPAP